MISRASVIFAAAPCRTATAREWGLWLSTAQSNVSAWRYGDRTPNAAARQAIRDVASKRFGVEIIEDWWDERPTEEQLSALSAAPAAKLIGTTQGGAQVYGTPARPVAPATADDTAVEGGRLLQHIRSLQDELTTQGGAYDLSQRISMADKLAASIDRLGRLTGIRLTERQILASPLWLELQERIMKALESYPDAMRAVAEALAPVNKDPKA